MPFHPYRLAFLDLPHRFDDVDGQLAAVRQGLGAVPPVELALLPAGAITGLVSTARETDLTRFAQPLSGPIVTALRALAKTHRTALGVPFVERVGKAAVDSYLLVDAQGRVIAHASRTRPTHRQPWAKPGKRPTPVVEIAGLRVAVVLEDDPDTLVAEAGGTLSRADLLVWPTSWWTAHEARPEVVEGLAKRTGLFVANANWSSGEPRVPGQGHAGVWDATGRRLDLVRYAHLTDLACLDRPRG